MDAPSAGTVRALEFPRVEANLLRSLKAVMQPTRQPRRFGLLCVRVDASEAVEALLGRAGAEKLLELAFERLRHCVRTTDIVSAGADSTFFILATDLQSEDEVELISDRIQRTCRQPYWIHDQEIRSGLTTGGVGGSEAANDPALLTQHAVLAMRRAAGRGVAFEFYSSGTGRPQLAASTEDAATAAPPFQLQFYPQFDREDTLCGVRVAALLPNSPRKTRQQVPMVRGRHQRLGDQVLRAVLELGRTWRDGGLAVPTLSIEIGAHDLLSPGFAESLLALLDETRTAGDAVDLLLTEATALTSLESAQRTLALLAEAGVTFGLSGFSLNAGTRLDLRKLPFSSLRVSCASLFKAMSPNETLWLVRSLVGVAERCGLVFIGEDITSEAERNILLEGGCERFEGPLLAAPADSASLPDLMTGRRSTPSPQ